MIQKLQAISKAPHSWIASIVRACRDSMAYIVCLDRVYGTLPLDVLVIRAIKSFVTFHMITDHSPLPLSHIWIIVHLL